MDGVLVLSEKLHFAAWQHVLEKHCLEYDWIDFNEWIGISDTVNAKTIIERFDLPYTIDDLYQQKKQKFIDLIPHGFDQHRGRDPFLQKAHQHFKMALVSSASKIEIQRITQQEQIDHYFQFAIGNEDVLLHKPHPMPYLQALEKANICAHEAMIIEDSHCGLSAALSANIPVIGLKTEANIPKNIKDQVQFFNDYTDIERWLFN